MKALIAVTLFSLAGCANAQVDLSKLPLSKFTHADIQNAAAIATANGYPARAAVWAAIDAQLTACEGAVAAALPKLPTAGATVGVATLAELGAEGVGQGVPANVLLNCSAIVLPKP